jgi:hypothetical protein
MNFTIKELNELIYSLGITALNGRMLDKELNQSLMEKLHAELGYQLALEAEDEEDDDGNYLTIPSDDEFPNSVKNEFYDYNSHYVSNEEADEDYRSTLEQDSDRYETSVIDDYRIHLRKLKTRGYASQALLDYVDLKGAVTHKELERYYKQITGSNSFSHILQNLVIPYKNRKTQRYLAKEGKPYSDAKYVVKIANPSNWVEKSY